MSARRPAKSTADRRLTPLVARRVARASQQDLRSRGPLLSPLQEENDPKTQDATDRDRRAADQGADANSHRDDHDIQEKFAEGRHGRTVSRPGVASVMIENACSRGCTGTYLPSATVFNVLPAEPRQGP